MHTNGYAFKYTDMYVYIHTHILSLMMMMLETLKYCCFNSLLISYKLFFQL